MPRFRVVHLALLLLPALALAACGTAPSFVVRHEPWRAEEERACLASGLVHETPFVTVRSALGGPLGASGACGALKPFKMAAAVDGSVALEPSALVRCPMVHAIEYWTNHVVKPAARRHLGADVVAVKVASSFACRPMNHVSGAFLSEHGHANALDVAGFGLADGRIVKVTSGWSGSPAERGFLREVRLGSCTVFTTVLGPGYDALHHDHFHLDLARHRGGARICK
ncbi:MAG: extensin family protein [Hyphomicrobiaceae bacterium]